MGWKHWAAGCIGAVIIGSGVWLYNDGTSTKSGKVEIFQGASLQQITTLLEDYDIVDNGDNFYYYLKAKMIIHEKLTGESLDYVIKQGKYDLKADRWSGLMQQLEKGPSERGQTFTVTVPEGNNVEDIADILHKENIVQRQAFLQYVQDPKVYRQLRKKYTWLPEYNADKRFQLEGYLHANTYYLGSARTVESIVDMMLQETDALYKRNADLIKKTGLTFDQVLTMASIVEKESKLDADRPKVAQVFYNRLKAGMKLQSDITAIYALGKHKVMLSHQDIAVESPFNTYVVDGLPIGPINSPSRSAIRGVLLPAGEKFTAMYFYARPNGETFYAQTFEEHKKFIQQYRNEWVQLEKKS